MKVHIWSDSALIYGTSLEPHDATSTYEVDDETAERWARVESEWEKMQLEIRELEYPTHG